MREKQNKKRKKSREQERKREKERKTNRSGWRTTSTQSEAIKNGANFASTGVQTQNSCATAKASYCPDAYCCHLLSFQHRKTISQLRFLLNCFCYSA